MDRKKEKYRKVLIIMVLIIWGLVFALEYYNMNDFVCTQLADENYESCHFRPQVYKGYLIRCECQIKGHPQQWFHW